MIDDREIIYGADNFADDPTNQITYNIKLYNHTSQTLSKNKFDGLLIYVQEILPGHLSIASNLFGWTNDISSNSSESFEAVFWTNSSNEADYMNQLISNNYHYSYKWNDDNGDKLYKFYYDPDGISLHNSDKIYMKYFNQRAISDTSELEIHIYSTPEEAGYDGSNNGGNSEGNSSGSSGGSSGKSYPSSDPTGSVPGFSSYNKDKQIELMHVAILPYCTDPYLYTTHYFKFDSIDETNKKYIFIETRSQEADDVYCIKGPYADLGLMKYANNANIPPYGGDQSYTSEPEIATFDDGKSNLKMFLQSLQETGDTAGRELLFDINFGRVRPLGNNEYYSGKYHRINQKVGNKWNGVLCSSLMCRYVESIIATDYQGNTYNVFDKIRTEEDLPGDKPTSYPSGHSAQFYSLSLGLCELYGLSDNMTNAQKYMHIGYKIGIQRSIGRWHWHSDILYGKLLATMLLPILNASDDFRNYYKNAYTELIGNLPTFIDASTLNFGDTAYSPYKEIFEDFKLLVNKIGALSNSGITWSDGTSENETVWKYLWWMYKEGRAAIDSNVPSPNNFNFDFFNNTNYKNGNIGSSVDSWFPEIFPSGGHQITPNANGTSITVKLHGSRTEYRRGIDRSDYDSNNQISDKSTSSIKSVIDSSKNLANHEILCSWLMACCLSEIYCNSANGTPEPPNNQTRIFAAAYEIGGGRSLNLYDEYKLDHDPMYLRLAAGIIYAYCRGKFNDNIRTSKFNITDVTSDGVTNKEDVNAIIGNDAERIQWRDGDGYSSGDVVKWGVDSYYIFPNAPGPYVNGRGALAKPYEKKQIGSSSLKSQSQSQTLFITDYVIQKKSNNNEGGGGGGSSTTEVVYSSPIKDFEQVLLFDNNNLIEGNESVFEGDPFTIGIVSDIHMSKGSDKWYDEDDIDQVLKIMKNDSDIKFIACCGDVIEGGSNVTKYSNEMLESDTPLFKSKYQAAYSAGLRFFTCLGNHDFCALYESRGDDSIDSGIYNEVDDSGYNSSVNDRINTWWNVNIANFSQNNNSRFTGDIHYFRYDSVISGSSSSSLTDWGDIYTTGRKNNYSKFNYYVTYDNNIFVFISLDYGNDIYGLNGEWHDRMIHARQIINTSNDGTDRNHDYINAMKTYVSAEYNNSNETKKYDYQYYHPQVLIWLKEIVENNQDKKIFVFTHHFITNKVGNNGDYVPSSGKCVYSVISNEDQYEAKTDRYGQAPGTDHGCNTGSNVLTGLQFYFLRKLINSNRNIVYFSGHSHISWKAGKNSHITNKDYDIQYNNGNYTYSKSSTTASSSDHSWCIALPSMSKPQILVDNSEEPEKHPENAEYTIMKVYHNGLKIEGYSMVRSEVSTGGGGSVGNIPIYESNSTGDARIRFINGMEDGEDAWLNGKLSVYFFNDSSSAGNGVAGSVNRDNNIILGKVCGAGNPNLANWDYQSTTAPNESTAQAGGGGQDYVMKYADDKNGNNYYVSGSYSNKDGAYILNKIRLKTNEYVEAKIPNEFIGKYFGTWEKITVETGSNPAIKLACTNYGYHGSDSHRITDAEIKEYTNKSTTWGEYYAWKDKYWPVDTGPNLVVKPIKNSDGTAIKVETGKTYYAVITGYTASVTPLATNHYRISHNEQWPDYSLNQIEEGTHVTGYGKLEINN